MSKTYLADKADLNAHEGNKSNPHSVTKSQLGLSNVDNTSDVVKPISTAVQNALSGKANSGDLNNHLNNQNNPHVVTPAQIGAATIADVDWRINNHANNRSNPHGVTAAQVGLSDPQLAAKVQALINSGGVNTMRVPKKHDYIYYRNKEFYEDTKILEINGSGKVRIAGSWLLVDVDNVRITTANSSTQVFGCFDFPFSNDDYAYMDLVEFEFKTHLIIYAKAAYSTGSSNNSNTFYIEYLVY